MATPSPFEFLLIIERGQSRFPQRPINTDRFLIGAGSNCHLQLGGEIPFLHSIIVPEGDHLWIDAVVAEPSLVVNGQQIRDGELHRGDVLEIGSFVFSIDCRPTSTAAQAPESPPKSAAELVDAIAAELDRLGKFAQDRQQAATALIDAAMRAGGPPVREQKPELLGIQNSEFTAESGIPTANPSTDSDLPPLRKTA